MLLSNTQLIANGFNRFTLKVQFYVLHLLRICALYLFMIYKDNL